MTLKKNAIATQPKPFLTLYIFQQTWFCLAPEITFTLHHFLTPKNYILEALWKQISVYFFVRKLLFQIRNKILYGGGLWFGEKLNNFLKAVRCLGLVKCFTISYFNWKFVNSAIFSISILPSIALKRWNFPYNLDFIGKIVVKFLIRSHLRNMTIKQQIKLGGIQKVCHLHNGIFHPIHLCQFCSKLLSW